MKVIFYGLGCSTVGLTLIGQGSVLGFSANRVWFVSRFYIFYIILFTLLQSASVLNTNCSPMQLLVTPNLVQAEFVFLVAIYIVVNPRKNDQNCAIGTCFLSKFQNVAFLLQLTIALEGCMIE